ncbi:MAG: hypothetical protein Q8Q31_04035 [Nanoarchaeota archaeon]|nr:hypothetical protein [Nanoarchaeota archaeon]
MLPHTLPYYSNLVLARAVLETSIEGYPDDSCVEAATLVSLLCPDLELRAGTYMPTLTYTPHAQAWNYDPKRSLYINIALDIFQSESIEKIPKIAVHPLSDPRFEENPLFIEAVTGWRESLHKWHIDFFNALSLLGLAPSR